MEPSGESGLGWKWLWTSVLAWLTMYSFSPALEIPLSILFRPSQSSEWYVD